MFQRCQKIDGIDHKLDTAFEDKRILDAWFWAPGSSSSKCVETALNMTKFGDFHKSTSKLRWRHFKAFDKIECTLAVRGSSAARTSTWDRFSHSKAVLDSPWTV